MVTGRLVGRVRATMHATMKERKAKAAWAGENLEILTLREFNYDGCRGNICAIGCYLGNGCSGKNDGIEFSFSVLAWTLPFCLRDIPSAIVCCCQKARDNNVINRLVAF